MRSASRTPFPRALVIAFVIVAAAAVGGALGFGLRKLIDGGDSSAPVARVPTNDSATGTAAPPATVPTSSTTARTNSATAPAAPGPEKVRFVVKKATYMPATTASGVRRNRARLAVALSVRNRSSKPYKLPTVRLLLGRVRVRRDPGANKAAGPLTRPVPAGSSAVGELRFETVGSATTTLAARKSVTLDVDGRRVTAKITK